MKHTLLCSLKEIKLIFHLTMLKFICKNTGITLKSLVKILEFQNLSKAHLDTLYYNVQPHVLSIVTVWPSMDLSHWMERSSIMDNMQDTFDRLTKASNDGSICRKARGPFENY